MSLIAIGVQRVVLNGEQKRFKIISAPQFWQAPQYVTIHKLVLALDTQVITKQESFFRAGERGLCYL